MATCRGRTLIIGFILAAGCQDYTRVEEEGQTPAIVPDREQGPSAPEPETESGPLILGDSSGGGVPPEDVLGVEEEPGEDRVDRRP